ncbi:hypothetical protein [Nocardia asiatica]|uniref:hypothetical protein n=1 Tax=Nocardia asiatica TaxID=209252 RepID=UPI00245740EF|nr:hypothetical protein [Nocardia asiatica]
MPRIRTIKPEFWDSPDTATADLRTRLLFIAMWNWADDYGIGDATPVRVIGFAFPHDDIPASEYPRLLKDVSDAYGVVFFRYDGRSYYVIPSWNSHQRTERKAKPKQGLMEAAAQAADEAKTAVQKANQDLPTNVAEIPTQSEGSSDGTQGTSGPGTGEQGKGEQRKEETRSPAPPSNPKPTTEPAGFQEFWATFPRRQGKGDAIKAWAKAIKKADAQVIIDGALRYATDPNREDQYTAMAASWLNAERWSDDPLPDRRPRAAPMGPSRSDQKVQNILDIGSRLVSEGRNDMKEITR